ncbi:tetratricopeptide repeat protein [Winogradskyella sp. 3972H.M.0a.05]|uniref:ATP-binding protein n=1 Tax=Winogradskyella sp. 3972H.M.0a.05 TaxID=2950277 RepID=UPI00339372C8
MLKSLFFYLILVISFHGLSAQTKVDSISNLIQKSKNNNISPKERLDNAQIAFELANTTNNDSIVLESSRAVASAYFVLEDYENYKKHSEINLELSTKLKDSVVMAIATQNIAQYYYLESENDSAYYYYSKVLKLYNSQNNLDSKALVLLNIADIQETEKDYIGSEENAVKAIKIYQSLPVTEVNLDRLWSLNNLIGIISLKLKNYDKSLDYHNQALEISERMEYGDYNRYLSINNIAFIYRKKENYNKALELYQSLVSLKQEYDDYDPTFYPLIIDNIAYTKLLAGHTDYNNMLTMFNEAYAISDSLEDDITKLAVSIDLTKFYLHQQDKDLATNYGLKSYDLAKKISSNDILLESMILLSKLKEGEEGKRYLNEHIKLSDSLLNVERNKRNKYARIELETDELEAENVRISQQRLWLTALSISLLIAVALVYVVITQRAKNKELRFVQDQQKANEEIYNLMLSQQDKVDEARANEKKRISQELHDGVLGRLFGTRLSLDSLNFSEGKDAIKSRMQYIDELKTIEQDIRKISHDLNTDFVAGSGFMDILSELIEKQTKAYQLTYDFDYTDDINWELIPNKTKINVYRVVQESMQNIYKHAQASHIKISIKLKNNVICLGVSDNGIGFDVQKSRKGIGLKNINSRVDELEGDVVFSSELNKGTTVDIKIPYLS